MNSISIKQHAQRRLTQFHHGQSGAVALLVLAAILIVLMISLVIFDTGRSSRDKITVSAAADAAAWSQSSVEARSMNMIAFSNVAKRVTFGMTSYYVALWLAYTELLIAAIILAAACWLANIPAFGALTPICKQVTQFVIQMGKIMAKEAPDLGKFAGGLNKDYFGRDMKALNDYQEYMLELTPWWGWSEQFLRGTRNGASMTASFPAPKLLPSSVSKMLSQTNVTDSLPLQKDDPKENYSHMCDRAVKSWDIVVHIADYLLKSKSQCTSGGWQPPLICALTSLLAVPNMYVACPIQRSVFGDAGAPYEMKTYSSPADWQFASSNLVFAYKSGDKRMTEQGDRKKYGFIKEEHNQDSIIYKSGGYWAMSRSEISFQGGKPSAWYPSWTARMRPVALPGEWQKDDIQLKNAWRDVAPYMIIGATLDKLVNNDGASLENAAADLLRIELSTSALNQDNVTGVSR